MSIINTLIPNQTNEIPNIYFSVSKQNFFRQLKNFKLKKYLVSTHIKCLHMYVYINLSFLSQYLGLIVAKVLRNAM